MPFGISHATTDHTKIPKFGFAAVDEFVILDIYSFFVCVSMRGVFEQIIGYATPLNSSNSAFPIASSGIIIHASIYAPQSYHHLHHAA